MRKIYLVLLSFLIVGNALASAPNRPNLYISGAVIDPVAVTANETTLYSYLQTGVDTYAPGSISNGAISPTAAIPYSKLNLQMSIVDADIAPGANIDGSKLGGLGNISSSAGLIPFINVSPFPYIKVSEVESTGTNAGNNIINAWTNRVLNNKDNDTSSIASLSGNQISLPAGTYLCNISSPFYNIGGGIQLRLQNITASTTLILGQSSSMPNTSVGQEVVPSLLRGLFTLSSTSTVAVQYFTTSNIETNGLGLASNSGSNEVYSIAEFTKIQ